MDNQDQEKTTVVRPQSGGKGCAYLLALVIVASIEFVDAVPYYLSFYAWCVWHFTIWQVMYFVRFTIWQLSTNPSYRKRVLASIYGLLTVLAWLVILLSIVRVGVSLAGWSLPPIFPALPWYVIVLADVLPLMLLCFRRTHKPMASPEQSAVYEVGSPEYNAQVVSAIRTLNMQLASQGKRVPERVAIDIIHQVIEDKKRDQ